MKSYTGKLVREDLEGGVWILATDDGRRLLLDGDVPADLVGRRVRVEGQEVQSFGIAMTGDGTLSVGRVDSA